MLEKEGRFKSFEEMDEFHLEKNDFFRYLQSREYYNKEVRRTPTVKENTMVRIINEAYNGKLMRLIFKFYHSLIENTQLSTEYLKSKWETEINIEMSSIDWKNMWINHQKTTASQKWRQFSWKTLIRFF